MGNIQCCDALGNDKEELKLRSATKSTTGVQDVKVRTFEFEDKDGDGKISMAELRAGLTHLNMDASEINALFDFLNADDDGVVTLKELGETLEKHGSLHTPKVVGGKNRLFVVDKHADPVGVLAAAVLSNHTIVKFDHQVDSLADIIDCVKAARKSNGDAFMSAALVNHGGAPWPISKDVSIEWGAPGHLAPLLPLTAALAQATHQNGRVDLLACDLLKCDPHFLVALEYMHARNFTASDDKTGNAVASGDWVMESDGVDISHDYFDQTKIGGFKDVLWGWNPMEVMDCIPIVGTVARVAEAGVKVSQGDMDGARASLGEAALNAAGDAVGLATGGTGKVAMTAARVGAKVVVKQAVKQGVKQAVKAGARAAVRAVSKQLTRKAMQSYAKKYFKKKIKAAVKREAKAILKDGKQMVRDELEAVAKQVMDNEEAENLDDQELYEVVQTIAECEDADYIECEDEDY